MAKKSKDFFRDASLSLKRERNKARENIRDNKGKHPGNKGFIEELNRQDIARPAYSRAKKEAAEENYFKGEDIVQRKVEQSIDLTVDPSKSEKENGDKGMNEQINQRLDWMGIKK